MKPIISVINCGEKLCRILQKHNFEVIENRVEPESMAVILNSIDDIENIINIQADIPLIFYTQIESEPEKLSKFISIREIITQNSSEEEIMKKINRVLELDRIYREKERLIKSEKELLEKLSKLNSVNRKLMIKTKNMENELAMEISGKGYSKKAILKRIAEECSKVIRYDRNFAVAVVEVSTQNMESSPFFKEQLYSKVSLVISENIRGSDVMGILREGVFILLLPEIIEQYTIKVIEKIINAIENQKFKGEKINVKSGFFVIDKERSQKFQREDSIVAVCEKLLYFSKETNKKIIEYSDEKVEIIDRIKQVIADFEDERHSMIIDELTKSKEFISKLLPKEEVWEKKLNYSYIYNPFNFIGGDFFDFVEISEDKIALIFCDVSGHGVSSALYITAIKYVFKNLILKDQIVEPDQFLNSFNNIITELSEGNIFVTTIYGYINKKERSFTYSFGGGTSPIKISPEKRKIEVIESEGVAVGIIPDNEFNLSKLYFDEGDMLLLYSDGVYEFLIENGLIDGFNCFLTLIENSIANSEKKLVSNIYKVMQEQTLKQIDFDDDLTIVAIKF